MIRIKLEKVHEVEVSMWEPWVDPLLQELGHIDLTADSDDADGNSSTLRSVEQIVEERLVPVGTEQVEFFKDEYNRFTGLVSGFQAGEEKRKMIRERSEDPVFDHIFEVQLTRNFFQGDLVVRLKEPVELNHNNVLGPALGFGSNRRHFPD